MEKEDKEPQGHVGDEPVFEGKRKISLRGCWESSENSVACPMGKTWMIGSLGCSREGFKKEERAFGSG